MDPSARFAEVVGGSEAGIPLDEAALLIAAHAHEDLDVGEQLARLDDLAAGVWAPTLDALRSYLFLEQGFAGNELDYHDERNSYLDDVLERRVGIPITLAVLMMEVGRRIGVPLAGVSMPGHFLVRDKVDPEVFVDPFARGEILDRDGCQARFHAVHGGGAAFDPMFLEPAGKLDIVTRMLANLEGVAIMKGDRPMLTWVLALRTSMPGAAPPERRRLASVLTACGDLAGAAAVLEHLAVDVESVDRDAAERATMAAHRLRSRLN